MIDGGGDKAGIAKRLRTIAMTDKGAALAVRDDDERQLVALNRTIPYSRNGDIAELDLSRRFGVGIPHRSLEGRTVSVGGHLDGGDNGPVVDANRMILNTYIRTSGLYDGVADFDAATLDPSTGNMKAEYLPNSQFTELPWDYLHPNHAGYTAMGEAIDLSFFASHHH